LLKDVIKYGQTDRWTERQTNRQTGVNANSDLTTQLMLAGFESKELTLTQS